MQPGTNPFGEESCEAERSRYASDYPTHYFHETPFNEPAMAPRSYLFVGRRGAGKTSLVAFFEFQSACSDFAARITGARATDLGAPRNYFAKIAELAVRVSADRDDAIDKTADLWTYSLWQALFTFLRNEANNISLARECQHIHNPRELLPELLHQLAARGGGLHEHLNRTLHSANFLNTIATVKEQTAKRPVIISVDVLEHYQLTNEGQMRALAALIQAASVFDVNYSPHGIFVKLFVPAEIFPHLTELVVLNPGKVVRNPVYLHWRPKDLMRLACWRFYQQLTQTQLLPKGFTEPDWTRPRNVRDALWDPFFGSELVNGIGLSEDSAAYVLRHTQLRPRQLIRLCNRMAERAAAFPRCSPREIVASIASIERELAMEVINSYSRIYPTVDQIVQALHGLPMTFRGSELDRVAKRAAHAWTHDHNQLDFRRLVAELGIVGRVRQRGRKGAVEIVEVDFEYFLPDRIDLNERDECAIHPMFFARLGTQRQNLIVYPFPEGAELGTEETAMS